MATDTRERLLQAASDLIWERSFHSAGVDQLCARADARKGSFYHYFSSKTDLAVEAISWSWEHTRKGAFDPIFLSDLSGLEKLRAFFKAVDDFQRKVARHRGTYPGCPFGGLGSEMAHQDEQIRQAVWKIFVSHCEYFESALNQAVAEGTIPDGDIPRRARSIMALLQGAFLMAKVANHPDRFAELIALVEVAARTDGSRAN